MAAQELSRQPVKWRLFRALWRLFLRLSGDPHPSLETSLHHSERFWLAVMHDHLDYRGVVPMPDYPHLTRELCRGCKVVPHREDILALLPKGGRCIEVGVQEGLFSRTILDVCEPRELLLVDIDLTRYAVAETFASEIRAGSVRLHEGDSAELLATLPDGSYDMIYIDAGHSYQAVKRDIAAARSKVTPDGYLVFNDYTFWSPCEGIPYGVIQAVNELCLEDGWELRYLALGELGYCDVAARRLSAAG